MRPTRLIVLASLGLAISACSLLDRLVPGYRIRPGTADRPAVTRFEIQGAHAVSEGDLKERLVTQQSDGFFAGKVFWRETRYFDEDAFANDRRRILRYYQARGYYGAQIASSQVTPDGQGRVKVVVRVDEGKPTRVVALDIDGMDAAPEARQRLGRLPLRKGDVFTEDAYDATRAAVLSALTNNGWAKAEVAQLAQVDPARAEARVRYMVTPGARYRFGNVFVAGAAKVPRARIREEAELAAKPGQTFDGSDLPRAQARVYDLGVFGGVRISQGPPDEARKAIPVVVSVREAPFRTVRAGPGFTFQSTRWETDLTAGWTHRNWLGGLRKLSLDARVGYAWLGNPFKSTQNGPVGLARADFTQPAILGRAIDLNLHGELERGLEPAYNFFAERLRLGTPMHFGRLFTFTPSVNLELYQLSGAPAVSQANAAAGNVLLLQTCPRQNPNLCLVSYFEQRFIVDLRDDALNTRRGLYLSLSVQEGFSVFGSGSAYLRLLPEVRGFAPLPLGMVLAGRARVGLVDPSRGTSDVPIVAKFTSGGPNLMRGYYTRDLSPVLFVPNNLKGCAPARQFPRGQNVTPTTCLDGSYLPVGGNGLIDGSLELRFPLGGNWSGATFLDFGDVRLSTKEALNVANLQYAVGLGVRYNTLFGPVRIDVATRLPTAKGGDHWPGVQLVNINTFPLQPTGEVRHDPIVSVHLSIGEAF